MEQLFIIGGMGAGKSVVREAIERCGVRVYDFDEIAHAVLFNPVLEGQLIEAFGSEIMNHNGDINRSALASKAFSSETGVTYLNRIMFPYLMERYFEIVEQNEKQGASLLAFEASNVTSRLEEPLCYATKVLAVLSPIEARVERAVAHGWKETDVRARIAAQISDEQRAAMADVVFYNTSTIDALQQEVIHWFAMNYA